MISLYFWTSTIICLTNFQASGKDINALAGVVGKTESLIAVGAEMVMACRAMLDVDQDQESIAELDQKIAKIQSD